MNSKLATPNGRNRTCTTTKPVAATKLILAPISRLLWAAALVLLVFGAKGGVVLTTLYTFGTSADGANPSAALVQDRDGYFYGTTAHGGAYSNAYVPGFGTVFKISANGSLTNLYSFTGGSDGGNPASALVQGRDGYFYGTAQLWGLNGFGTVFKIDTNGSLISLYSFTGGLDGAYPYAALVDGGYGNFYGTTSAGGDDSLTDWPMGYGTPGLGSVFGISTNGALTNLHALGISDGGVPSGMIQGGDGLFYGTSSGGGGPGSVFQVSSNGTFTNLYSFPYGTGISPAALVRGNDGYFYGTTEFWGANNDGTVFKIGKNGLLTTLYSFTDGSDGGNPTNALVLGGDGNFYGTTSTGGMPNLTFPYGAGTLFKISTSGALTTLYSFTGLDDGGIPNGLIVGRDGSFYGTTQTGGAGGTAAGTVFRLTIVPDPQLTINLSESNVVLAWPTNYGAFSYAAYALQSTANLDPSSAWTPVSSSPAVVSGQNVVTIPTTGSQQFFRLSQ